MKEENNTKKDFELFEDLCDILQFIKEKYIYLELKFTKKDSVKNDKIILGIDRMWAFSYLFTREDLKKYPLKISGKIIESIQRNFQNSNFASINEYDVFLVFINEVNECLEDVHEKGKEIEKLLIKELPNVYEKIEDYKFLKNHKKDLINEKYSIKEHTGIENTNFLDFLITHIDEQQKYLTYKSSQIIKEKVDIDESIKHPFKSDDINDVFQYLDKYFKPENKVKYTYIFDFIKNKLEGTLNETLYFDFIISSKQIDMVNRAQATATNQKKKDLVCHLYSDYSNNTKK